MKNPVLDQLIQLRRQIHQHPEISGEEVNTAAAVVTFFKDLKYSHIETQVGGTGVLVTFDSGKAGKSLLFRAELDGLPIQEEGDLHYKSVDEGKGHQCGHDGHLTILAGVGAWLSENPPKRGKVHLIFQPAEENGEGAKAVMNDERFKGLKFDEVYALHNLPGYPLGQIVVKENSFTAAVNSIIIKIKGKTSHAAEPEKGLNPSLAVAEILNGLETFQNNNPELTDFRLITPVYVTMGSQDYGISAGDAEIHLTLRSWTNDGLADLERSVIQLAEEVCKKHHLIFDHEFLAHFYANENDQLCVDAVRNSAESAALDILEQSFPFKWGEDFGIMTTEFKGCMFGLGSGEDQPALHNPDYDFPDELIPKGIAIFTSLIKNQLK
ncbi:amidohydrolase [Chryseobacterium lacus]|uniref:amidohydrolase n=1 Tax=Chryseobacterium lacus TaxID=2058346 RepID=UPI000F8928AD|nr:amidohydrolase [Chryseobacterium lacus]RST27619.1 amidohydrolase [Chryseobacterium lacus]